MVTIEALESYLKTVLFSESIDRDYSITTFSTAAQVRALNDLESFFAKVDAACALVWQARNWTRQERLDLARDFWLTRNGHGAGFWDGDWPAPAACILTDIAKSFGPCDVYEGDDRRLHFS